MRKRRGSLFKRIMAVTLSAVLAVGMIQGALPVDVLAQEESVSENTVSVNMLSDELLMAESATAVPGDITADEEWDAQTLEGGIYTIHPGVTVTLNGVLTVSGDVTIEGGGRLVRGDTAAHFALSGGNLTLQNIEVDGASLESSNAMITVTGNGKVTLGEGCRIHHCYKNANDGAVLNLSASSAVFRDAIIENCQSTSYGGAIYMAGGSSLAVYGGTYRENCTTSTSSYGGGFVYNRASKLEIYGGSFIDNTSYGRGGCIYNTGISGTETYLYGGYFQGNKSAYTSTNGKGSGAVFYSSENTADTTIHLSGNVQFCGDGVTGSGVDGIFLGLASNAERKAKISSELKYPLALYLAAEEGRVIAEGVNGYQLQKKDMKKITFTDVGSSGTVWYARLDEENNQVILTTTNPEYHFYVTYAANGGEGEVSDNGEYSSDDTVTVQPGDALWREGYSFGGWNTQPDGTGTAYRAGETFRITDDVTLYAQWIAGNRVIYDYRTNGGSFATKSIADVALGAEIDLTPTAAKAGWEFVGWNTDKDAHEGLASLKMGDADMTLYAIYKRTLTATFYSGSRGTSEKVTTTIYNRDTAGSVRTPALKEWTETSGRGYGAADWLNGNTNQACAQGESVTLTGNTSFYGRYEKTITITYHANGGTGSVAEQTVTLHATVNDTNVDYGEASITLKDGTGISRPGYIFDGWYDNGECSGAAVTDIPGAMAGSHEYYAKWTDNIAPVIGPLEYSYQPKNLWQQLIGRESLIITVPVTEEGSGADKIIYTVTPDGGTASEGSEDIRNGLAKLTVSADFKGTIAITCTDHAGNTSAGVTVGAGLNATGVIIEDNAPRIAFMADNEEVSEEEYAAAFDVTVTVTDDKDNAVSAGLALVSYQVGDGAEKELQKDFSASLTAETSFVIRTDEIPAGRTVITVTAVDNAGNRNTVTQPLWIHEHSYGTEWEFDAQNHWRACACGEKSETACHDFGAWITDKEAAEYEEGHRYRICRICQFEEQGTVSALGTIDKDVKTDGKAPDTQISTPAEELADMLLEEEEKHEVEKGTDIRIILDVKDISENVSSGDKALLETALGGYTTGQYLDISLYKLIGESRTDITETPDKIRITIAVPDALKNADSQKERTFAIIRIHENQVKLLEDLDDIGDIITIETDRFSTYAIVYKDEAAGGSGNDDSGSDSGNGNEDNKGDDSGNGNNSGGSHDSGNGNNSSGGNDSGSGNSSSGNDDSGNGNNSGGSHASGSENASSGSHVAENETSPGSSRDKEPKTGDAAPMELYATLAMIAGFAYLRLYFADRERGMTEETKKELVSRLVAWAKRGGRLRKCLALAAIFVLLVYYHSIGKRVCGEWKEVYGE